MKNKQAIVNFVFTKERNEEGKFWMQAFLVYAAIEIFILGTQYIITRSQCVNCVMPPFFYFVNWLQHLLFTGLLWFFLNKVYNIKAWKIILVNVFAFLAYYFLWLASLYAIFHSGQNWMVWDRIPSKSFDWFVYGSWADIGKYVLKLSAFYALKFYFE